MIAHACQSVLFGTDIRCLLSLRTGDDIETYTLTIGQGLESRACDCGKMSEEIITPVSRGNEAEALCIVEPLYSTCCHVLKLLK